MSESDFDVWYYFQVSHTLLSLIDPEKGQPVPDVRKRLGIFMKMLHSGISQNFGWLGQSKLPKQSIPIPFLNGKDYSGIPWVLFLICLDVLLVPIICYKWVTGNMSGAICEKLFPEIHCEKFDEEDASTSMKSRFFFLKIGLPLNFVFLSFILKQIASSYAFRDWEWFWHLMYFLVMQDLKYHIHFLVLVMFIGMRMGLKETCIFRQLASLFWLWTEGGGGWTLRSW